MLFRIEDCSLQSGDEMNTSRIATSEKRLRAVARSKDGGDSAVCAFDAETGAPVVDIELVDRTILKLNAICRQVTMDFAIAVGKVVVDTLHSGNLESWRTGGAKGISFRMLARHPDLPMSPAALCRSVAIYELSRRLEIAQWKRISTSHIRLVLPLAHSEQARLLALADAQSWSVSRLNQEVATIASPTDHAKGGRRREPPLRRTMTNLGRCIDELENLLRLPHEEISAQTARSVRDAIPRLREACRKIEDEVRDERSLSAARG
jgi:hypothetical protein